MYSHDESSSDLDRYMKIIESEARELRECTPLSAARPNFNQNRRNVGAGGGGGGYNSRSTDNSADNYGRQSNRYDSGNYGNKSDSSNRYGGNSGGYGTSSSNSYGNSGGSNNYGGSTGGSNSYGSSNYGHQTSSSHGFGGTSNNNAGSGNHANSGSTDWTSKNTGYGGNSYGNSTGRSNYESSGASNSYGNSGGSNNYGSNSNSQYSNAGGKGYAESNNVNYYGNAQSSGGYGGSSQSQDKPGSTSTTADTYNPQSGASRNYSTGPPVQQDDDGYQHLDFNRYLISHNEPGNLNIKHVFLSILNRSDLMEYTAKIVDASCQDNIVLAIQRDNQLAESYAYQLRQRGYWSFEVTNKTKDADKLLKQQSTHRCVVTTMSYLRDNVDQFQYPSLIINFDHVVSRVKFLERFLTYRNPASAAEQKDCYIYELCFNHSTTSQSLKEYIHNQQK